MEITIDYLRIRLRYEPDSGKLFWREAGPEHFKRHRTYLAWNTRFAGKKVGALLANGYFYVNLKKRVMLVHRVIFAMVYGYWPANVDHINHVRTDNKLTNLRDVSISGNAKNMSLPSGNTSGRIGVYWVKQRNTWRAAIKANGVSHRLGHFKEKADAIAAREDAERRLGFHVNHGAAANDNLPTRVSA